MFGLLRRKVSSAHDWHRVSIGLGCFEHVGWAPCYCRYRCRACGLVDARERPADFDRPWPGVAPHPPALPDGPCPGAGLPAATADGDDA